MQIYSIRQKGQGRGSSDGHLPAVDGVGGGANFNLPRCLAAIAIVKLDHCNFPTKTNSQYLPLNQLQFRHYEKASP